MRVGRNESCPCGSGIKYKKCCLERDRLPTLDAERDGDGRLIGKAAIETDWPAQDKHVRVIGSTVAIRPSKETDFEFYVASLVETLGEEWQREQFERHVAERHVVAGWLDAYAKARRGEAQNAPLAQHGENLYSSPATGELKALHCLAYDIYTTGHKLALPGALLGRLRHPDQFQGARYEIAVAAVVSRAGYEIEWLAATDRKLPEFFARHPDSPVEIAVEAKSRHRGGVLGHPGDPPDVDALKIDVSGLMKRALAKETDGRPLVVCLDLNLPLRHREDAEHWAEELHESLLRPYDELGGEPSAFAALFVTNYSWHWEGAELAGNPINFVIAARDAVVPLPANHADLLGEAVFQYGDVPEGAAAAVA
jgi:hypothetical protein